MQSKATYLTRLPHTLIIGLILLATWSRLWQLATIPPGLWFDEAYNGLDAIWMLDTATWPVFLVGNNGREAMYHYWLAAVISVLGQTTYAVRFSAALLGIVAAPLMYRWGVTLFRDQRHARWLALVGAAGLVTSLWSLVMNRTGYRANLLPIFVMVTSLLFWQGWQRGQLRFYLLAGAMLGLAQYSYFSARLLPLIFGLFIVGRTLCWQTTERPQLKMAWLGLAVMAVTAAAAALPLLIFMFNNPAAVWGRTLEVAIKVDQTGAGWDAIATHLLAALRLFVDGQDPNWRHHLVGWPMFDLLNMLGFFAGLGVALWNIRRPVWQFMLITLLVMWLPAPLANPAIHTLRLAGLLPAYYALVAVGLVALAGWLLSRLTWEPARSLAGPVALAALVLVSGGLTIYNYFGRWGQLLEVYHAFDGRVAALAADLNDPAADVNLVVPFYLYTHASFRFLLNNNFAEEVFMPAQTAEMLRQQPETPLLIPAYPPDDGRPPAYAWLKKAPGEKGAAYVSAVFRPRFNFATAEPIAETMDRDRGVVTGRTYAANTAELLPLFPARPPQKSAAVAWAGNLRLAGYELRLSAAPDESPCLYLSWVILGATGLQEKMFVQLLDGQGNPVGQQEVEAISRKMYRWRKEGLILELLPLNFAGELAPGTYFVRLGFFDPKTGQRLPAVAADGTLLPGAEFILGPLEMQPDQPLQPVEARLGEVVSLTGFSAAPDEAGTRLTLYWQSLAPTPLDYTVFVQLLDAGNQIIAQVDAQPLPGLFPTSRWQPGDRVPQVIVLPAAFEQLAAGSGNRLATGMYNLATGERLPAYDSLGNLLPDGMIELR